jgi:hypothetical protein
LQRRQVVWLLSCPRGERSAELTLRPSVLMCNNEFLALDEHAAAAAAGVEDPALVGFEHFDQQLHHRAGGVELSAFFALRQCELAEEVFEDPPEHVFALRLLRAQRGRADEVNEAAEAGLVEFFLGIHLGQHAPQAGWVVLFDGVHRIVYVFADGGEFGPALQPGPAAAGRHVEDLLGEVFVAVFGVGAFVFAFAFFQFPVQFLKSVGDVFQEDEAEHDVFVLGSVHVLAELVGGFPEFFFEGFFLFCFLLFSHVVVFGW